MHMIVWTCQLRENVHYLLGNTVYTYIYMREISCESPYPTQHALSESQSLSINLCCLPQTFAENKLVWRINILYMYIFIYNLKTTPCILVTVGQHTPTIKNCLIIKTQFSCLAEISFQGRLKMSLLNSTLSNQLVFQVGENECSEFDHEFN